MMGLKEISQSKRKMYDRIFVDRNASLNDIADFNEISYMQTVVATLNGYAVAAKELKTTEEKKAHMHYVFSTCAVIIKDRSYGSKDPKIDQRRKTGNQSLKECYDENRSRFLSYDYDSGNYEKDMIDYLRVFSEVFQCWRLQYLTKK